MNPNHPIRLLVDESGTVRGLVAAAVEVRQDKRIDNTPCDVQAQFARVGRATAMGELAASIAHEVNQPLAAIVTNAESCLRWLGKERPDLDRARLAAERIVRSGHHASEVIRSIRAMLQPSTPQPTQLDINELITDVLDLMRGELRQCHVLVEMQLCIGLERIMGDRTQLQQVVVNLIRNGIEAMSETSTQARLLAVSTSVDANGAALISVADTGSGIDPAVMSRIFEPFFTTKSEGMGVGLSICRRIVEAHGGRLWASPRAPQGSTFQFTLPMANPRQ